MRKLLYTIFCILPLTIYAQTTAYELEGTVTSISADSIITLKITLDSDAPPPIKQQVSVYNKMVSGNFTGTVGVADAEITSYTNGVVTLQVLKYTGVIVKDGVRSPLIKVDNTALLKWEMEFVKTYMSEYKRADAMMDKGRYDDALLIMDSLYQVKPDKEVLYSRGVCYYNAQEYEKSVEDMTTLIKMDTAYIMGYYFRSSAYMLMDDREADALRDLDYVLKYKVFTKKDLEIQMRDEHAQLVIRLYKAEGISEKEMQEKLCADYKRLAKLDSDNMTYYSDKNCYCNTYNMKKIPESYIPVKVTVYSDGIFVDLTMLKKSKYKWYNEKHKLAKTVSVGTYVYLDIISESTSMNVAVAKVVKVEDSAIELKIEYWTMRSEGLPYVPDLKEKGSNYIITW